MDIILGHIENYFSQAFSNVKIVEKAMLGLEGSYVELLTILGLGLLAVIPIFVPKKKRQLFRHVNQIFGVIIFVFVVFTCLGVFGMIRNFERGLSEIGRENIVALYYCSVPVTILVTSLLFGPVFCGWICPTGALQEFFGMITKKWNTHRKKLGYPFSRTALVIAIIVLAIFILWMVRLSSTRMFFVEDFSIYWAEIIIVVLFVLVFRMNTLDRKLRKLKILSFAIVLGGAIVSIRITSPVHFGFAKVYDPASFLSTVIIVLATLSVPRVWCRYLCPWKCAIAWTSRKSVRAIEYDRDRCTSCGTCDMSCDIDAITKGTIDKNECLMCLKCVDSCPVKALELKDNWGRSDE
jgi:polyferredoxin